MSSRRPRSLLVNVAIPDVAFSGFKVPGLEEWEIYIAVYLKYIAMGLEQCQQTRACLQSGEEGPRRICESIKFETRKHLDSGAAKEQYGESSLICLTVQSCTSYSRLAAITPFLQGH